MYLLFFNCTVLYCTCLKKFTTVLFCTVLVQKFFSCTVLYCTWPKNFQLYCSVLYFVHPNCTCTVLRLYLYLVLFVQFLKFIQLKNFSFHRKPQKEQIKKIYGLNEFLSRQISLSTNSRFVYTISEVCFFANTELGIFQTPS